MSLSFLPDSARPRAAIDPSLPAHERQALRKNQDLLARATSPPPDHSAQILELEQRNETYEELLARTAAHELATERVEELAEGASEINTALHQATDAGKRLGDSIR